MVVGRPVRALLVDDHRVVRAGLTAILNDSGRVHVVAEASDGAQAVALISADNELDIDVILLDLQMPQGLGGVATLALLKERGIDIPALILTTYESDADITAAMSAGAKGYLLKDASDTELIEATEQVAHGGRALSPTIAGRLMDRYSSPSQQLSERELEILESLARGLTNKQIAKSAFVSEATVKTHLVHIYSKLGVDSRTSAIAAALEQKLIRPR